MITITIFLMIIGCFILLKTSKKAVVSNDTIIDVLIQSKLKLSKTISIIVLMIAMFLSLNMLGRISGALFWLISLATVFSLVIIITPLKIINYKGVLMLFFVGLIFEKIIY